MGFVEYNEHTEELIRWFLDRLDEDEVLAGAVRHPYSLRFNIWSFRDAINGYRKAVHRVVNGSRGWRWLWLSLAHYHAFCLREAAHLYADRGGFNPAWLRAPRRR